MTLDDLKAELADIMGIEASAITDETSQDNTPEWDSMASLQLISLLDEAADGEIEADEAEKLTNFAAVVKLARARGALSD